MLSVYIISSHHFQLYTRHNFNTRILQVHQLTTSLLGDELLDWLMNTNEFSEYA